MSMHTTTELMYNAYHKENFLNGISDPADPSRQTNKSLTLANHADLSPPGLHGRRFMPFPGAFGGQRMACPYKESGKAKNGSQTVSLGAS